MTAKIEVEIRGPLNKEEFFKLKNFLQKNGNYIKETDRFSLIYFRDYIPKDLSEIKDEKVDLRLRITNKKAELVMKYGSFGGSDTRKEFSFLFPLEKFTEMTEFLTYLGWKLGVINATKTFVYNYKDIEFALVEIKGFGYYYEAEILIEENEDINNARRKIIDVCKEMNLREFTNEEFNNQCNKINNTKELNFNFEKKSFRDIIGKFKEFF